MQLILNAETTVEIKTKMSINEENLEKCVSNILSAVENGVLPNGDIVNGNEEDGDSNKNEKHKQIEETKKINTCGDLEQELNDVTIKNAQIELSSKNNDVISKKLLDKNEELVVLPNVQQTCEIPSEVMVEPVTNTKEQAESCKIATETELNDGTTKSTPDLSEKVAIEEEHTDHVSREISDFKDDLEMDTSECLTVDKEHVEPTSIETGTSDNSTSADVSKCVTAETEQNEVANMAIVTDGKDVNSTENTSMTLIDKKELAKPCTQTELTEMDCSVDKAAQKNIAVEDHIEANVTIRTELNDISSTLDLNTSETCEEKNIASKQSKLNDVSLETDVEKTQASTDEIAKINIEKELNVEEKSVKDKQQTIDSQKIDEARNHVDTTENKSVKDMSVDNTDSVNEMEIAEKEMSVVNEHDNEDSENVKTLEKEINSDENEQKADGDKKTLKQIDLMDIDETPDTKEVKENSDANSETSLLKSPSNLNGTSEHTVTVDCNTIEPVSVNIMKPVELLSESSDDIIFNLDDDDKEQTAQLEELKEKKSTEIRVDDNKTTIDCDNDTNKMTENVDGTATDADKSSEEVIDLDEAISKGITIDPKAPSKEIKKQKEQKLDEPTIPPILKLSNTLNILSDEEEDPEPKATNVNNKCINIEDDDDIMLIDDDTSVNEKRPEPSVPTKETESEEQIKSKPQSPLESMEVSEEIEKNTTEPVPKEDTPVVEKDNTQITLAPEISDKVEESKAENDLKRTLLQEKFLKTCKKNLSDMTREELEEFCILKIVESILDRSNLSEIRTKLKTMTQNIEDYKKKAMMLTKQNRDLQVVLKSIQEDQKKGTDSIVPLKITRSVGMQVLMADKSMPRRKNMGLPPINKPMTRNPVSQSPRPQKPATPQIPVPRLVPANNPTLKSPNATPTNTGKIASPVPNGIRTASPVQKGEKRTHNRIQSVTVDLTDDEPPAKVVTRAAPAVPPVRLVPSQNLLAPPRPTTVNSPRKVYIPISGPQGQSVRPGQTIMLKTVPPQGSRQRCPPPHMVRMPQTMRMTRPQGMRHPAPLPDCVKQYQPPNWKALPPAPDLKLAKVENGIVISWKIEGYQEDSYEEIASYQLYAYQETSSPPSTALWKKIGDVKALPLPMACTLTQFMAGYKYYFAVRALDIRSRLGPFSLPGSILLLNKM